MITKSEIRGKINIDQRWLERAVLAIDARQTADETAGQVTIYDNDRGWNAADAKFGGRLAKFIRTCRRPEGQRLSIHNGRNYIQEARNLMQKYCGQLARIAAAKEAVAA
jgi:hypothetical protein